ncbi:MAG: hypothetical protein ABIO70_30020 [Pseudomonadota bacterium]
MPPPSAPLVERLLAPLAVAVLLGFAAQAAVVGAALAQGWPRWRAAGSDDLQAALLARVPDASAAAPLEPGASASTMAPPTGEPDGPQRDPSCQWLADNLHAAGNRLEKRGVPDPVTAEEREAAVGFHGCSPEDPAVQALFDRYADAFRAAGLPLPGRIFPGER